MRTGSCRTSASTRPSRSPLARLSELSNPTKRTLPAQPLSCSTRSIAKLVDSLGQKIPSRASRPSGCL